MRAEDERTYADYVGARTGALRDAYLLTGDPDAARNAVLRALTAAHADWHRAERDGPDAYVKAHILRDELGLRRRLARRRPMPTEHEDDAVWSGLAALPPRSRAILVLRYGEQLTDGEIAQALAMTPAAVRAQSAKAIATLARSTGSCGRRSPIQAEPCRLLPDPVAWVRAEIRRRRRGTRVAAGVAVLAVAGVALAYVLSSRAPAAEPAPRCPARRPPTRTAVLDAAGRRRHRHRVRPGRHERVAVGTRRPGGRGVRGLGRRDRRRSGCGPPGRPGRRHSRGGAGQRSGSAGHDRPRPGGLVAGAARRRRRARRVVRREHRPHQPDPGARRPAACRSSWNRTSRPAPLPCKPNGADWSCATTASRARGCNSTAAPTTAA